MKRLILIACVLALTGCANTDDNLQRASAVAIGGNVAVDSIKVTDVDRGVTTVKWKATTPNGTYTCNADDMVRQPYCSK